MPKHPMKTQRIMKGSLCLLVVMPNAAIGTAKNEGRAHPPTTPNVYQPKNETTFFVAHLPKPTAATSAPAATITTTTVVIERPSRIPKKSMIQFLILMLQLGEITGCWRVT